MTATRVKPAGRMAELAKLRSEGGEVLPMLKEQMLLDTAIPDGRVMEALHVSDLVHTSTCWRAVTARMLSLPLPEESFSFQRENVFAEGNAIHRKWQYRMRRTGKLYGQWKCLICGATDIGMEPSNKKGICTNPGVSHLWDYDEIPFYHEPLLLAGHADGGVGTAIIELKSVGTGTLRFEAPGILAANTITRGGRDVFDMDGIWNDIRRPFPSHVRQGNMYCWLAAQQQLPFDHVVFIYEFKPNQQVKEFTVKPSLAIIKPMLDQAEEIAAAVREHRLLPCPHGGCKKCEGIDENGIQAAGPASRPGEQPGSTKAPRPGHQPGEQHLGQAAAGRTTPDPGETPGPAGQRADGTVPPDQPVAEIPPPPAGHGRGRRITRRSPGEERRGDSTLPGDRENSRGNESTSPRRRVIRRSSSPLR